MNILIIDDHALVREGIAMMIGRIAPHAEIAQAASCEEGLRVASASRPDFVFLDLQLPDDSGLSALRRLREAHAATPVVVISAQEDRETVMRALDGGARAFLPKTAAAAHMQEAFAKLLEGRVCLPDSVMHGDASLVMPPPPGDWSLTERQKEVLALIIMGLSNKLIARRLNIVESTVKIHVSAILRELKVASRTQAIIAVARYGIKLPLL